MSSVAALSFLPSSALVSSRLSRRWRSFFSVSSAASAMAVAALRASASRRLVVFCSDSRCLVPNCAVEASICFDKWLFTSSMPRPS